MKKIISFVHGYHNLKKNIVDMKRPALLELEKKKITSHSFFFPRNPEDFFKNEEMIVGNMPNNNLGNFKKLPRFGFTGIANLKKKIFCGSWNGIYEIDSNNFKLKKIISNNLMSDIHGIDVKKEYLISVLTCKDTVVFTDFNGKILNHFTINKNLGIVKNKNLEKIDWRFVSKQFRGSTGFFHFNYIYQRNSAELWLTSRNLNSFVVVNLRTMKAELRMMNLYSPVLVHDGFHYKSKIYLTSIDGKILIANENKNEVQKTAEKVQNYKIYNKDLNCEIIRLDKKLIGKIPNWCRGIKVRNNIAYVLIDGRYDTKLRFSLLEIDMNKKKLIRKVHYNWKKIDKSEKQIRYCSGFDLVII